MTSNPKYYCSFCKTYGSDNLRVYRITDTYWYLKINKLMVNACDPCIRKQMVEILENKNQEHNDLRNYIKFKAPEFCYGYIQNAKAKVILQKLRLKRTNNSSIDQSAKRACLDSSTESGTSIKLAPFRGTLLGGGRPGRPQKPAVGGADSSQSQPQSSQSQQPVQRPSFSQPSPPPPPPRANVRSSGPTRRVPVPDSSSDESGGAIEAGIAPQQVPRQRQPQADGFRMVGA